MSIPAPRASQPDSNPAPVATPENVDRVGGEVLPPYGVAYDLLRSAAAYYQRTADIRDRFRALPKHGDWADFDGVVDAVCWDAMQTCVALTLSADGQFTTRIEVDSDASDRVPVALALDGKLFAVASYDRPQAEGIKGWMFDVVEDVDGQAEPQAPAPARSYETSVSPGVWPESGWDGHGYDGQVIVPPEMLTDMLETFAEVFHRVYDLRDRLRTFPAWEEAEPVNGIVECILQDAKAAFISTAWTSKGQPTSQQEVFWSIGDREPMSCEIDGWRFDVEAEEIRQHEHGRIVRWGLVATEID